MKKPTNFTLSLVDPIAASLVLKHERNFPANARDEILARTEDNHDFDFIADPRDLVDRIFRRNGRVGTYYGSSWDEILAYNAVQVAAGTPANCVAFEDSAGTIPLLAPLRAGKGCGLLKDRSGGNHHRIQTSATARGEMSRRVNLLESTNTFDASMWAKQAATVTPMGTQSELTSTGGRTVLYTSTILRQPGTAVTRYVEVKAGTCNRVALTSGNTVIGNAANSDYLYPTNAVFDLTNGDFVSGPPDANRSAESIGGGWWRLGFTSPAASGDTQYNRGFGIILIDSATGLNTVASGQSVYIRSADFRLASDSNLPYQRVTSASDYDEEGFPAYLRRQTDDWSKAHINPNGATKVFVLTAIQKMRDAAIGAVLELGANPASGSGNFSVLAPATAGPTYSMGSKGSTALVSTISDSTFPAPVRSLVVGIGDIANDVCSLTVNGTTTTSAVDQGIGTYTEQDVFFGARAGTSMFVNDREYSPPMILFMQPGDPGISAAAIRNLTKLFSKGIRL